METLTFTLSSKPATSAGIDTLCGVVGSGNLEVLIQPAEPPDQCHFTVTTSAKGFSETWRAVLQFFADSNPCGGTRVTLHDLGATPAVVSLRLAQTLHDYSGSRV